MPATWQPRPEAERLHIISLTHSYGKENRREHCKRFARLDFYRSCLQLMTSRNTAIYRYHGIFETVYYRRALPNTAHPYDELICLESKWVVHERSAKAIKYSNNYLITLVALYAYLHYTCEKTSHSQDLEKKWWPLSVQRVDYWLRHCAWTARLVAVSLSTALLASGVYWRKVPPKAEDSSSALSSFHLLLSFPPFPTSFHLYSVLVKKPCLHAIDRFRHAINSTKYNKHNTVFASKMSARCNRCFPGPNRVLDTNGISIALAIFAGLTSWQTDWQTDRPRYSVGSNRR